ncbi:MAG: alpha/beta hydrolase [bacterium]|nr:alpha/beta hydrolase [bacterium]
MYLNYLNNSVYYEKHGKGKNVILILPGWGDNRRTFDNIIKSLEKNNTIYIFDYPGFGKSDIPNKDLDIYDYSKIIINFLEEKSIKNPIIIGHSFGGRIVITLSGYYNIKFDKIILISAAGIKPHKSLYKKIKEKIYKLLKKIAKILPKKKKEIYLKKLINIFGSNDYKSIPHTLHKTFINIVNKDLTDYLSKINDEVLLIWGEKDSDTPLSDGKKMNKLIKESGLVIIKNAHHFCYLEYSKYIIKILKTYLKKYE